MSDLNPGQKAVVGAPLGGLFVSAGAGTGKTRVLTERFVRLVVEATGDDALERVGAITYTNKAAGELHERIRARLALEGRSDLARRSSTAWIGTIHGTCTRLLRRHAFEAGLDPAFTVLDDVERGVLMEQALAATVRDLDAGQRLVARYGVEALRALPNICERVRSLGVDPGDVDSAPVADPAGAVARAREGFTAVLAALEPVATTATAEGNRDALLAVLEDLDRHDRLDRASAAVLLDLVGGFSQTCRGREDVRALAVAAREVAAELAGRLADALVSDVGPDVVECLAGYSERYEALKETRAALDFTDLQVRALELLRTHQGVADRYRERFVELMIDEFQDTDALQLDVASALAAGSLATVGDEKQSIYSFRNADVAVYRARAERLDDERRMPLAANYRSHPELLRFLGELFSREPFWPDDYQRLEPGAPGAWGDDAWPEDEARVSVIMADLEQCEGAVRVRHEASALAACLARLRDDGIAEPGEMVVLLRAMTNVAVYQEALAEAGFEVFLASGGAYFATREVLELTNLVRTLANVHDDEALVGVLSGRMAAVSDDALCLLRRHAREMAAVPVRSLWSAATDPQRPLLAAHDETALVAVVRTLEDLRARHGRVRLYDLVHEACERLDYDLALVADGDTRAWANALKFARMADDFERVQPGDTGALVEYLRTRDEHVRYEPEAAMCPEDSGAVRIMSVHSAKGLEFPVVAVAGLGSSALPREPGPIMLAVEDGSPRIGVDLPSSEKPPRPEGLRATSWLAARDAAKRDGIEEEKRLFYVACTRAERALVLSGLCAVGKPPGDASRMDWVREALDLGMVGDGTTVVCGTSVAVHVHGMAAACEIHAPAAQAVDPMALEVLESVAPEPPRPASRPERISYSGLALHADCPYRYYVQQVLRVPAVDRAGPGGGGAALAFGSAFHDAIAVAEPEGVPSERLDALARRADLDDEGSGRLRAAVEAFMACDVTAEAAAGDRIGREVPFAVAIDGVTLDGSIDMISWSGEDALVVDYKTGSREPDERTRRKYELQGRCYALAALRSGARSVRVEFVHPERGCATESFVFGSRDAQRIESDIAEVLDGIGRGEFPHLDSYEENTCRGCPALDGLCPVTRPASA